MNPALVGSINTDGKAVEVRTMKIGEKFFALVEVLNRGLRIIGVSDPSNPALIGSLNTDGEAYGLSTIEIRGNLYVLMAFLGNAGGLEIIEVIDPSKPVPIGILYYGD